MDESRTFSRIQTYISARLRKLPTADAPTIFMGAAEMFDESLYDSLKTAALPEAVTVFLIEMDKKLDMILSHFGRDVLKEDLPLSADIFEIGGDGLKFTSKTMFHTDDYVEIVVMLSKLPLRTAGAVGRITSRKKTDAGDIAYSLEFTRIRESDQDSIVRFVFHEERRKIREKKWD